MQVTEESNGMTNKRMPRLVIDEELKKVMGRNQNV